MTIQVYVNVKIMKNLKKEAAKLGYLKENFEDKELDIVGTDNRDINTTILNLSNGSYIEVNPIDLMGNAIENADDPKTMQQFKSLVSSLGINPNFVD